MTALRTGVFVLLAASALITAALSQSPAPEGRVTWIFHDVQLLPAQAKARPAALDDNVDEGSAVRTGDDSRSELTFADLTIARLGADTIFSVSSAGRSVQLDSGSILLYARKNSGGAQIMTKAVTVGISGTTVIFESRVGKYDQLTVLEGTARFSLNNYSDQSVGVRAGELLHVKAGMQKLPPPRRVDLRRIVRSHPLIKDFPPLPSLALIEAEMKKQNPNLPVPPPSTGIVGAGKGTPRYPGNVNPPLTGRPPSPVVGGFPRPSAVPTFTPRQPLPTPKPTAGIAPTPTPTAKPIPRPSRTPKPRPIFSPKPSPKPTGTPKKLPPRPPRKPKPTPKPGQIIP
jgi:hypothetical protein